MAKGRATFAKRERERAKAERAKLKAEKRVARSQEDEESEDTEEAPVLDQEVVLTRLAELHAAYDDGRISLDDFETQRDELRSQLRID